MKWARASPRASPSSSAIPANRKLVERLGKAGLTFKGKKKERGTKLAGKTFVLTGTLANYTRDEAKKMIEDAGGKVSARSARRQTMWWPERCGFEAGQGEGTGRCRDRRKRNGEAGPVINRRKVFIDSQSKSVSNVRLIRWSRVHSGACAVFRVDGAAGLPATLLNSERSRLQLLWHFVSLCSIPPIYCKPKSSGV